MDRERLQALILKTARMGVEAERRRIVAYLRRHDLNLKCRIGREWDRHSVRCALEAIAELADEIEAGAAGVGDSDKEEP
jgi:hypothetical protein